MDIKSKPVKCLLFLCDEERKNVPTTLDNNDWNFNTRNWYTDTTFLEKQIDTFENVKTQKIISKLDWKE